MKSKLNKRFASILVFALVLALILPGAAFATTIHSDAKAKSLAKKVVGSGATVVEVDSDYEDGCLVYEVDLIKGQRKYSLTYRASDAKLIEYESDIRDKYMYKQKRTGKDLSASTIKSKAKKKISKATITSSYTKHDDGLTLYVVKMTKSSKQYKLTYNKKSGSLIEYQWELKASSSASNAYIGSAQAKTKAKNFVKSKWGVTGLTVKKVEFEKDDGVPVYEVEMYKGSYEYEIVVHAKTGKILEWDRDRR